jgi:hypothetical protein
LFNDHETTSQQVVVALSSKSSSSSVNLTTYDKAIYDLSGSATGTPPDPFRDEHLGPANYHQHGRADPASDPDSRSLELEHGHHPITESAGIRPDFL